MREFRIHPWLFAVLTTACVVTIGVLAALVTWVFHQGPKKQCVLNCPPPVAHATSDDFASPDERAFHSPAGFDVSYPTSWKVHGSGRGGVSLDTDDGGFFEVRPATGAGLAQLIVSRVRALDPQTFPDLKPLGPIRGAQIGGVSGVGTLYGGTMVPGGGGGSAQRVRFAIIAAERNGLAVVVTAADWYDRSVTDQIPTGMPNAQSLDYALTEFRWPGG
jgi:hypothetical protein